ncbi:glycosyltransferase family 25 protein [Acinetobacter modestus]|uniref:glycosyltransferase family 25 protein n=1 Tax=Acinetobacter TaxID=469 RepID=UPI001F4B4BCE|nr:MULTISPECIES: glycosyltransferase family 25 protein [Acinetobacter]MCH7387077.1 glycosyltransferase family 25 protein [Acinetobacter modestus]WAU72926.1 glycosyltransferase family 25 protein [Acinetobacter sp. TR11]
MEVFVISLSTASQRRQHINQEFAKKNLDFTFFDALTPEPAGEFANHLGLRIDDTILTKGELACFMSHVYLWNKMIQENIPYMAIFEDDIYLGENIKEFLSDTLWLDSNWHLIKVEEFTQKVALGPKLKVFNSNPDRAIFELKSKNLGTAGYILSLSGAKKLLDYIQSLDQLIALDHLMFEKLVKDKILSVCQMKPALCIQDVILYSTKDSVRFASHLYKERQARMKSNKKRGVDKILLELSRIFLQIRNLIFFKTVGFK